MQRRRGARRLALEVLYEQEVGGRPLKEILARHAARPEQAFAAQLVEGVRRHREEIDQAISAYAEAWTLERMPVIDRNLLRIGIYEIRHLPEVPVAVTIDEIVEVAKTLSTEDSGRFINGVLARVAAEPPAPPNPPPNRPPPPKLSP